MNKNEWMRKPSYVYTDNSMGRMIKMQEHVRTSQKEKDNTDSNSNSSEEQRGETTVRQQG